MKRTVTVSLLLLLVSGCAKSVSLIEIDGRAPPNPDGCKFTPGGDIAYGPGVLDVGATATPTYRLAVYVKNQLPDPTAVSPDAVLSAKVWYPFAVKVRVNPSDYVSNYSPNPALLAISTENTNPLDGQAIQPAGGSAVEEVEAVSGALGTLLKAQVAAGDTKRVILGITLQGQTADGASLDTSEWFFPLNICNGCIVAQTPTCTAPEVLTESNCFGIGQDTPPTCVKPAQ